MTASLDFVLHRKPHTHEWSIVFSRAYGMAAPQLFCTLNAPTPTIPLKQNQFYLNPAVTSSPGCTLAELLAAKPSILRVVGPSHRERAQTSSTEELETPLLEVLLPEEELVRRCAGCGDWKTTPLDTGWIIIAEEGSDAERHTGNCARQSVHSAAALAKMDDEQHFGRR